MLKKFCYIILTILCILVIIGVMLGIFEFIYSQSDEILWKKHDLTINRMNKNKLQNEGWYSDILWSYKDENILAKKDKKRILVVGDSFVWGDGYDNANNIWWQQLRNKLKENGYNDVEIIAAGISGYTTKMEFDELIRQDIINKVNPDLIIWGFVINDYDIIEPYNDDPIWNQFFSDEEKTNIFSSILSTLYPNIYEKAKSLLSDKYNVYSEEDELNKQKILLDAYCKYVLPPIKKYLQEKNIPFFFVFVPYYYIEYAPNGDSYENIFKNNGITLYNLTYEFSKEVGPFVPDVYNINLYNSHPGTKSTAFTGREVLKILEQNYSSIIGNKTEVDMDDIIINDPMPRSINLKRIDDETFTFTYPKSDAKDSFLWMPLREKYIKLNFMYPVDIDYVEIDGEKVKNANLYIQKIDQLLNYDNQKFFKVEYSEKYKWFIDTKKVTSISLHLDIKNGSKAEITIKIKK